MPERQEILHTVAAAIMRLPTSQVVRVGIDGVDGAGKSMLGDELAQVLAAAGRRRIRPLLTPSTTPKPSAIAWGASRRRATSATPITTSSSRRSCSIRSAQVEMDAVARRPLITAPTSR